MRLELLAYDMSETRRVTKRLGWIKYPDITHRKRRGVLCVSSCVCVFESPQCSGYRASDTQQHADKVQFGWSVVSVQTTTTIRRRQKTVVARLLYATIIIANHNHVACVSNFARMSQAAQGPSSSSRSALCI